MLKPSTLHFVAELIDMRCKSVTFIVSVYLQIRQTYWCLWSIHKICCR